VIALAALASEGLSAFGVDRAESRLVTPYLSAGAQIDSALPSVGVVLGPERWWWALHDHPYISLRSLWFQWVASDRLGMHPEFTDLAARWQPESVVVNNNIRNDLLAFPTTLQDQFWRFIQQCTTQVAEIDDPTYFETQIYRVTGCA
jgi:hypothetical protein